MKDGEEEKPMVKRSACALITRGNHKRERQWRHMHCVKLLVVVLLAGCLGGLGGKFLSKRQYGAVRSDTLQGLGHSPRAITFIIAEPRDPAVLAEKAALPQKSGGSEKEEQEKVAQRHLKLANQLSNPSAERLTTRIARDKTEMLKAIKAGKYPKREGGNKVSKKVPSFLARSY